MTPTTAATQDTDTDTDDGDTGTYHRRPGPTSPWRSQGHGHPC